MGRWRLAAAFVLALTAGPGPAGAAAPSWHDRKCDLYRKAWVHALASAPRDGLGAAFLAQHQAFLDSNCTRRADVCPRSPAEIALADTMVVLSMNFGAASTMAPFYCR